MHCIIPVVCFLSLAAASPLHLPVALPQAVGDPSDQCLLLPSALKKFLDTLKISSDLSWKDSAETISFFVNRLATKSIDNFIAVCNARQSFYNSMGVSYESCLNRLTLFSQGGTTLTNVLHLEHLFKMLQFECSTGFDIFNLNHDCIVAADADEIQSACFHQFNATIHANPSSLCGQLGLPRYLSCIQEPYVRLCAHSESGTGHLVGWFACERERVSWGPDCVNTKCDVTA